MKLMYVSNAFVLVGTAINIVRLVSSGIVDSKCGFVEGMITAFCVVGSILAVSIISGFNKENLNVIEEKAKDLMEKIAKTRLVFSCHASR